MTALELEKQIVTGLSGLYDEGEALAISSLVIEFLTGSRMNAVNRHSVLTEEQLDSSAKIMGRLRQLEPVQYVLGEAWFGGYKFKVNSNVLVPRPETEELAEWIYTDVGGNDKLRILDVGTGSGCIPVLLKKKLPGIDIWSCDVSSAALEVAKANAEMHNTAITFLNMDFTDPANREQLPAFDIIVSNPPYIPSREGSSMSRNVTMYEPGIALFVPDQDPLLFYRAIGEFGEKHLSGKKHLYFEIHENLARQVITLLAEMGYETELKKDMQKKDRMIKAGLK